MFSFLKNLFKKPASTAPAQAAVTFKEPQAILKAPPVLSRIFRRGDDSDEIRTAQRILKENGYFDDGTPSGSFGPKTEKALTYWQQTHLGPNGQPLNVDSELGPKTWWSLFNPSGVGQSQNIAKDVPEVTTTGFDAIIPHGLKGDRLKVLAVACKEYRKGVREIPNGSNTGGEVKKYIDFFGMGPAAWCAMFVNWTTQQALGGLPWGKKQAHCATFWRACKETHQSKMLGTSYAPRPGDFFVMVHKNDTGHIGIVARVSKDGQTLDVIEGNSGNRLALRRRAVGAGDHVGYINFYGDERLPDTSIRGLTGDADAATDQTR